MNPPRFLRTTAGVRLALAALAACSVLAACSSPGSGAGTTSSKAPASPSSVASLTAQSRKESGLAIYGNAPAAAIKPLLDSFGKAYPWIKPAYSQLSDNQVYSKYQSEHAQGAHSADLLISSSIPQALHAVQNGQIANVTPQGLSNFPSFINQGHGTYVMSPEPVLVSWNAKLLSGSKVPTSYKSLAADVKSDPGHYPLVSYSPNNSLGYEAVYGMVHVLGAKTTYSYLDTYGPHTKTLDEGLDGLQYLTHGGASVAWLGSGLGQSIIPQYKGLADYGFMTDATPLVPRLIQQTAGATNPASAQLFLDYIYSAKGQQVMCAVGLEASMNGFTSANGCTANLTDLRKRVPASAIYPVPVSQDVIDQQKAISDHWNKALGR